MNTAPQGRTTRLLAALVALLLAVWYGWRGLTEPAVPVATPAPATVAASWLTPLPREPGQPVLAFRGRGWEIYFTRPDLPTARLHQGGPDAALARALNSAQQRIWMAAYDLNLWSLRDALLAAHRRGVQVRLVVDEQHITPEVQALQAAGVPVVVDDGPGLMHHKFVVIDDAEVWTGSMNFTLNGAYRNANNLIRVRSTRLAADYAREFAEMFAEGRFGPRSQTDTPYPRLTVDGVPLEVYFAPDDHPQKRLVALLRSTQSRLFIWAYIWTAHPLTDEVLALARRGVQVRGWFEAEQLDAAGHDYPRFKAAGLAVEPDPLPGLLHHKVLVLDGQTVVLGSYNFTRSADVRNDENVLVVHDADLAAAFVFWWDQVAP